MSTNKRQPGKNENDERVGDDCDEGEQRPDDSEQGQHKVQSAQPTHASSVRVPAGQNYLKAFYYVLPVHTIEVIAGSLSDTAEKNNKNYKKKLFFIFCYMRLYCTTC